MSLHEKARRGARPLQPAVQRPLAPLTVRPRGAPAAAPAPSRELWLAAHVPQLTPAADAAQEHAPESAPELLVRLALLAQRFTPKVSLVPPDGLLLEVKGSVRLYGGLAALYRRFRDDCSAAGARAHLALAPTALAALAGARSGRTFRVLEEARLIGALAPLPVTVLRWPAPLIERLQRVGVRTLGEVLRLPRAGFARRFGVQPLAALDRLVGRGADLRQSFRAPEQFCARHSFLYELESLDSIVRALGSLLAKLADFLRRRQCGITRLECRLTHAHAPATVCVLELVAPAANAQRLTALLSERMSGLALPEPVRAAELSCTELAPLEPQAGALWQPGEHGGGTCPESTDLIERLRVRLGAEAVYGLAIAASHRPEAASICAPIRPAGRARKSAVDSPPWGRLRRPLWLLESPEPLTESDGLPWRDGPLHLKSEPERIESGWWEAGGEAARDYYRAVDAQGVRLWIYREREPPHRWFLHGVFG